MQLKTNHNNLVIEWIPYDKFDNIKNIGKYSFVTSYKAEWKDGPLKYYTYVKKYKRNPSKVVVLKYFSNTQNVDEFINEV
jgi:hypothetical protein